MFVNQKLNSIATCQLLILQYVYIFCLFFLVGYCYFQSTFKVFNLIWLSHWGNNRNVGPFFRQDINNCVAVVHFKMTNKVERFPKTAKLSTLQGWKLSSFLIARSSLVGWQSFCRLTQYKLGLLPYRFTDRILQLAKKQLKISLIWYFHLRSVCAGGGCKAVFFSYLNHSM